MRDIEHFTGCLLGGAVGDALGAPIEFHSLQAIRRQHGPDGITGYIELNNQGLAEFTDDTQMTLFTAEGLLCAAAQAGRIDLDLCPQAVFSAYRRWLNTQYGDWNDRNAAASHDSYLLKRPELWKRRAPGNTCLSALSTGIMGTAALPLNNSKGCGGVMRVAPVGLLLDTHLYGTAAFDLGCAAGAATHGHPSGYLPAGFFAQVIAGLAIGESLDAALETSLELLAAQGDHEETSQAIHKALAVARDPHAPRTPETIEKIGAGWVGEEALAMGLYAALIGLQDNSFASGVLLAVNHSGDCDSTAAITGNLLGLILGRAAIPPEWLARLELRSVIEELAAGLLVAGKDPAFLKEKFLIC
jgi:ADP-ribosyl-[dinitrogen reductase] hydrolase